MKLEKLHTTLGIVHGLLFDPRDPSIFPLS